MKKLALSFIFVLLIGTQAMAEGNCAVEKKDQYDLLIEELKDIDYDLAIEARTAYGIVSGYEAFDDKSPRCSHIDKLLYDMQKMIDLYK